MSPREFILRQAGFVRGRAADVYVVSTPPGRGDYLRYQLREGKFELAYYDPSDWITPEVVSHVNKRGKRRSRGAVRYG